MFESTLAQWTSYLTNSMPVMLNHLQDFLLPTYFSHEICTGTLCYALEVALRWRSALKFQVTCLELKSLRRLPLFKFSIPIHLDRPLEIHSFDYVQRFCCTSHLCLLSLLSQLFWYPFLSFARNPVNQPLEHEPNSLLFLSPKFSFAHHTCIYLVCPCVRKKPLVSIVRPTYKLSIEALGFNPSLFTYLFRHPEYSAPCQSHRCLSEFGVHPQPCAGLKHPMKRVPYTT